MNCPTCSTDLHTGQKFCPQCGANVTALTLPVPPAGPLSFAPPTVAAPIAPLAPPPTDSFAIVEQTVPITATPDQPDTHEVPKWVNQAGTGSAGLETAPAYAEPAFTDPASNNPTLANPTLGNQLLAGQPPGSYPGSYPGGGHAADPATAAVPYPAGYAPGAVGLAGRGSNALAAVAGLAGVAAMVAAFLPMLTVSTDAPITERGDYRLNDLSLGTSMVVAVLVVAACLIVGGALAMFGKRIGAGIAAGAAVALVPVLVCMWGFIDLLSRNAEASALAVAGSGGGGTFLRSKQGIGLWVLIGAAAAGLIALCISLVQAGADGRPRLHSVIGLAGALASVVAAIGQLIPTNGASFGDNFETGRTSAIFSSGRIAMIALVAIVGAVGFLCSNRWGVGLALGGASIWLVQWVSSLAEAGDFAFPPGFGAPGNAAKPHIVTTIGVIAMLVLAALAILTAPKNRTMAP